MKRFFLLVFIFLPCLVHGQMLVFDAVVESLLASTHIDQMVQYGLMIQNGIDQIVQFEKMLQNTGTQAAQAAQNLLAAKDIRSWDDFKGWYNRQLYLERQAIETWDNMSVTIGNKQYALNDVYGIADGLKDNYIDYWNKEFTEEQRKEMWLSLGLTPANYAYVQPFRTKANEIMKQNLTAVGIQNDWYMRNMERNNERQKKLADDHLNLPENQMGAKEVLMMMLESLLETNKVMNDMAMNQAKEMEERAVKDALDNTPNNDPILSDYPENGFEPF